jgi:hypothetical protein
LTEPIVIPWVKYFWKIRKMMMIGTAPSGARHDEAVVRGHFGLQAGDAQCDGLDFRLVQHDQLQRVLVPGADEGEDGQSADAGLDDGHDDRPRTCRSSPAPSMRAASSREEGIVSENCFIRKTPNGQPAIGRITDQRDSDRPRFFASVTSGIRMTCLGSAMAQTNSVKMKPLPQNVLLRQRIAGQRRREAGEQHRHQRDEHAVDQPADRRRHLEGLAEQHHGHLPASSGLVVGGMVGESGNHCTALAGLDQDVRLVLDGSRDDPVQREDEQQRQDASRIRQSVS